MIENLHGMKYNSGRGQRRESEVAQMRGISYEPLWKKIGEMKMSKSELCKTAKLSRSTLTQLNGNKSVTLETILRICNMLNCEINDVVEMKQEAN